MGWRAGRRRHVCVGILGMQLKHLTISNSFNRLSLQRQCVDLSSYSRAAMEAFPHALRFPDFGRVVKLSFWLFSELTAMMMLPMHQEACSLVLEDFGRRMDLASKLHEVHIASSQPYGCPKTTLEYQPGAASPPNLPYLSLPMFPS